MRSNPSLSSGPIHSTTDADCTLMHNVTQVKINRAQKHAAKAERSLFIAHAAMIVAWLLSLCSCSAPQIAPRFVQPSTSAIAEGHVKAISSVQSAKKRAEDLEAANPALKLQIEPLKVDLENALSALDTSEGARKQLDEQLGQQTTKANKLADAFDTLTKSTAKDKAIVEQVNSYWGLGAFAYGAVRLVKHLLIMAAVIAGLVVILFGLSFAFPVIGVAFRAIGPLFSAGLSRVTSMFRRGG